MKSLRTSVSVIVAIGMLLIAAPAGAQSYEGDSLEEGILYIPDDLEPGSAMNFAISGMEPLSDLTFVLRDDQGNALEGIEVRVQGAVVVKVDSQGNFNGDISIPSSADDAVYSLLVTGTRGDGSAYSREISVGVGSESTINAQTSDDTPEALALTGVSSRTTALNGLLIVGVGVAIVAFAARRGTSTATVENT